MEKKIYTQKEAEQASVSYFGGDELAARVWSTKYALKDSFGNLYELTPDDMHHRLASEIARVESKYANPMSETALFELLRDFKYIVPAGSPMTGIGNDFQVASLSNCFVIGQDGSADSYGAIIQIDEEQVQLMKRRGGVGHDLSHIRPHGSPVKNSALTSTGLVPFMERYSNSTREVAQDGRRGALMLSVSIKHPDSEAFIDAKMEQGKVTGANVSVKVHDDFMQAAINKEMYQQQYPIDAAEPAFAKEVDAHKLWKKIIHNAWKSAEPGVLFWDTIARESVPDCYADLGYKTVSTNPCGEIPLCPYDSCRLLAINLYSYVKNPFTAEAEFDFELFKKHVAVAQRMMDDIIDLEVEKIEKILAKVGSDPESESIKRTERELWEKILEKTTQGRRTGVGTTAEGDMLAAMGLRYGTPEATAFSVEVHKTLALAAYRSSVVMAQERGAFKEDQIVTAGHMVLFQPKEEQHYEYFGEDKPEVYWVHFTGSSVKEILRSYDIPLDEHIFFAGTPAAYTQLFKNMIEEFQNCKVGYRQMLEMNLRQLFLMIQRTRLEKPPLVTTAVQQEMDFARQYFHEHYNEPINIEEYAQSRHTSISLFMRNFKKVYGVSPKQYILNIRMNNAQNLLETTDYTVAEIAAIVGYDNALYFSRIYHKQKGQAPSDYRKKMKEQ